MAFQDQSKDKQTPIAVIGMECFFPKASGLKNYWRMIFHGIDAITEVPATHWSPEDYFDEDPKKPDHVYCKRGGFLDPVSFDPVEFGIPPSTLESTDSSQLLALVAAKSALETAGYGTGVRFDREKVSVILGVTGTQKLVIPLSSRLGHPVWRKALEDAGVDPGTAAEVIRHISDAYVSWQESSFPGLLGNVVAGRISNRLDLGGTNCVVDAACASSFSALHMAVMELSTGRSDMVVAGGVDTLNDIFMHMCFSKTSVLSPTGDARPFSKDADGTVLGEGIGIVILKRLDDAEKHGDRIYAIIKGIGSSSDGKSQSIYAPRDDGQIKALENAYAMAQVDPSTIELFEAHGTGTRVGDEVEFKALNQFLVESAKTTGTPLGPCALGSVKSMIGHTKAAAGSAGLIKSVLSLYHKILPPTLKVTEPDPDLNINNSSLYLNTETRPWFSDPEHRRRAGASAFGFGGSNFHVVMEEYKTGKQEISWDGSVEIIALGADTTEELIKAVGFQKALAVKAGSFKEISRAGSATRAVFSSRSPYRMIMVIEKSSWELDQGKSLCDLFDHTLSAMAENPENPAVDGKSVFFGGLEKPGKMAFIFPGQGAQYVGMGKDLVSIFPEAFDVLEKANRIFGKDNRLTDFIYPVPVSDRDEKKRQEADLTGTDKAQPAIGSISLAMLKILNYFGLTPQATCGHSFGELPALNAAGWIDDDTLLTLAVTRGKLMAAAGRTGDRDPGTMMAVKAPLEELDELIRNSNTGVILANRNNPEQGVLSGPTEAIEKAEKLCKEHKFKTIRLTVAAAFHSHLMKEAQKPFMDIVMESRMTPTDIPVYSNSSGGPYPDGEIEAKTILGEQILRPVDFVSNIKNLYSAGVETFVEVGPKTVLTGLVGAILKDQAFHVVPVDGSGGKKPGMEDLAKALSRLAALGYPVLLDRWEPGGTDPAPGKPRMEVKISGANHRPEKKTGNGMNDRKNIAAVPAEKTQPAKSDTGSTASGNGTGEASDFVSVAFQTVQQGLRSIQALQQQTAETHQKFLEAQTESSRTLQQMIESTQRLVETSLGFHIEPAYQPVFNTLPDPVPLPNRNLSTKPTPVSLETRSASVSKIPEPLMETATPGASTPEAADRAIQTVLLETVSELTGYPVEMLGLDMDIEADLGIDSIKRVEILSTMEEKMPGLPQVEPEVMGTLKTLNQIMGYLSRNHADSRVSQPDTRPGVVLPADKDVAGALLETVSELTGYPVEMLGLDMDIEADLGIDSIKRVEILSTMEEKMPGLPQVEPEMMGSLKTLNQIIRFLTQPDPKVSTDAHNNLISEDFSLPESELRDAEIKPGSTATPHIERRVVLPVPKPFASGKTISIPPGKKVFVLDDAKGLSRQIVNEFLSRKIDAQLAGPGLIGDEPAMKTMAGLIILPPANANSPTWEWNPDEASFLNSAVMLSAGSGPFLKAAASAGGALFAAITALDGSFGFNAKNPVHHPVLGALCGLAKTAAQEWETVSCLAIDVPPDWNQYDKMASAIVDELLNADPDSPVEIGLTPQNRYVLETSALPLGETQPLNLGRDDVVVISGGARGVTAEAALALAEKYRPTLVLLGRSPKPFIEPEWSRHLSVESEIKKAILEHEFGNQKVSPARVGDTFRKYAANREIRSTLDRISATGAKVDYYSVDIRDAEALESIWKKIRRDHGPATALIHGAGVLEDRLIVDKNPEQIARVFETKVKGLFNLLNPAYTGDLKYLVLFSSVAARTGNKGQVDYAMANEALNKIARQENMRRPRCKTISINWGPWDGGMVSPALKKEFSRNHIALLPLKAGAEMMIGELESIQDNPVEVVIGSTMGQQVNAGDLSPVFSRPAISSGRGLKQPLFPAFQRDIHTDEYPVLDSHRLNGTPVVPLALMAEWFAHGALHENPGLILLGFDDMRVLNGIKIDNHGCRVRLMAGKVRKSGSVYEVEVEIRSQGERDIETIHSRARAILGNGLEIAPFFQPPPFMGSNGYSRSIENIYNEILFHGGDLQGIKEVSTLTPQGMVARLSPAPSPQKWMKNPLRNKWVGDPLVLDSAFQMASLWCYEQLGAASLPVYYAGYRQYQPQFPKEDITAVLEINSTSSHKITGNLTFLDQREETVARVYGYEAILDESLNKAFKPRYGEKLKAAG